VKQIIKSHYLRGFFLLTFVVNMFLMHVVLQEYVFCTESNGKTVLERINDNDSCCSKQVNISGSSTKLSSETNCSFCNDFTAIEKYGDVKSKSISKVSVNPFLVPVSILTDQIICNKPDIHYFAFSKTGTASPLEAYKTVSLLI
jgi:hypothetical protein